MKKNFIMSILLFGLIICGVKVNAQPGFDDDVTDTPIDAGILLLVSGSLAYGISKASKRK
jgi:hypothetical protein